MLSVFPALTTLERPVALLLAAGLAGALAGLPAPRAPRPQAKLCAPRPRAPRASPGQTEGEVTIHRVTRLTFALEGQAGDPKILLYLS